MFRSLRSNAKRVYGMIYVVRYIMYLNTVQWRRGFAFALMILAYRTSHKDGTSDYLSPLMRVIPGKSFIALITSINSSE